MKLEPHARQFRHLIALTAAMPLVLGGCELLSKPESTHFDAVRGGFKFRAIADAAYPEGSAAGEAARMKWLEQRLRETGTCPNGYTITERQTALRSTGTLGSIYDVYYKGTCKG